MRTLLVLLLVLSAAAARGQGAEIELAPGEPLSRLHIEELVRDRLPPAEEGRRFALAIASPRLPLANPARVPTRIRLLDYRQDPASGALVIELFARTAEGASARLRLKGRLVELLRVPTPRTPIGRGTVIAADMLEARWISRDRLDEEVVLDEARLIGREVRRRLLAGRPIRVGDLQEPRLVRRGALVTVVYRRPGLELTAVARALESGSMGEVVRLVNVDSRLAIKARVVGPGRAEAIGSGMP